MIKPIAFYLPQFHPIPENDKWWGDGFTEWTNVKSAKPLFDDHEQPRQPGELGYYDLLDSQIRIKQAELAKAHNIHGFCYWHYWFGNGNTLLEKPFQDVLKSGEPDFPFCLGWANESWTGIWHGAPNRILMEQTYPGIEDIKNHFNYVLPAFSDERYIKVDNAPFFLVYQPQKIPDLQLFTETFNEFAIKNGFSGIHFVATNVSLGWELDKYNFKAIVPPYHHRITWEKKKKFVHSLSSIFQKKSRNKRLQHVYDYSMASKYFLPDSNIKDKIYPAVIPNWDNSPRSGENAVIYTNSTPEKFEKHLREAVQYVLKNNSNHRFLMVKSWNEWAEGNYLEPDKKWGRAYLEVFKKVMDQNEIDPETDK
ncbi:glycosyltransferase WbsX family protein [Rhodohalobacter sp. 614A]|uniref:glycosyltransferase WbsX family protein n=1 Tax=Rhodohalobacter sp. 614A TaxID=2908649 RepID=UPI001F1B81AB